MFSNKFVSIDIGSKNIHIVEGKPVGRSVEVEKAVMIPTPYGSFRDGGIQDQIQLKDAVRNALLQNNIKTKKAVLTIQSTQVITRELILPAVKKEELKNIAKFEIEQHLPIVSSEYVMEFKVIDEFVEDNVKKSRINVAAMPKDMVESWYNFTKKLNLKPVVLDVHSNSVSKLLSGEFVVNGERYSPDKTVAVIDIGYQGININIVSKGKTEFSRFVVSGGKEIDRSIAANFSIPQEKMEQKKIRELGLDGSDNASDSAGSLNDLVRQIVNQWMVEIQKVFQYHTSRSKGSRIDAVFLYGGTSNIAGIAKYMEQFLNIHTAKLQSISSSSFSGMTGNTDINYYINAIGALIRYR